MNINQHLLRRITVPLVLAATLSFAGCGDDEGSGGTDQQPADETSSSGPANPGDDDPDDDRDDQDDQDDRDDRDDRDDDN